MIRSLKGRIHFAHVRNLKFNSPTDFEEAAHLSSDGTFDMYEIMKALYEIGFDGPIRPDHGRMIWDEVAMIRLYDRALGQLLKRPVGQSRKSQIIMRLSAEGLKTEQNGKRRDAFQNLTESDRSDKENPF